jgi:transposase
MIVLGCDPHKNSHTVAAIDASRNVIGKITIQNTFKDFKKLFEWSKKFGSKKVWGIKNSQHYAKHLAQFLLDKNEQAYEITPKLTAQLRGRSLKSDKSDIKDAIAIAKAVIQENGNLHEVPSSKTDYARFKEITRFRDSLVKKRTDFINQLHKALYNLDPEYKTVVKSLSTQKGLKLAEKTYIEDEKYNNQMQLILKGEIKILLNLLRTLEKDIKSLEKQIKSMTKDAKSPLSSIDGVGKVILPVLLGEIGNIKNYKNSAQLASRAGISPLENSSAKNNYKRVNSGGNRRLNTAIHRVALFQIRKNKLASAYYLKKQVEGKTKKEALRCLKRRLVDIIFSVMKNDKPYQLPKMQEKQLLLVA